jgi:hypothetical protein
MVAPLLVLNCSFGAYTTVMNPSETNTAWVLVQTALFMTVGIIGLSIMFGGSVGPGRLMRGMGDLFVSLLAIVFRGLVILALIGIAYVLFMQHSGQLADFLKTLSIGTTQHSP